jgi:hypothetical protein
VIYVYDGRTDDVPYYTVVCRCGWFAIPIEAPTYPNAYVERQMVAAALDHDLNAKTTIGFPLDEPR